MKLSTRVMRFLLDGGRKLRSDPRRGEVDYYDPNELCVKGDQGFYCVANTGVKLKLCGKKTTMLLNE